MANYLSEWDACLIHLTCQLQGMTCIYVTDDSFPNKASGRNHKWPSCSVPPEARPSSPGTSCPAFTLLSYILSICHPIMARLWHAGEQKEHSCNLTDFYVAYFMQFWSLIILMV